jgi:hypothetical protein
MICWKVNMTGSWGRIDPAAMDGASAQSAILRAPVLALRPGSAHTRVAARAGAGLSLRAPGQPAARA